MSSEATPTDCTAGDPIMLRLKVSGSGNFDRVDLAGLPTSSDWKAYKPSARFEPSDSAGYEGTKTFEQAVVPLRSGTGQIPAISFSYFDPNQQEYLTRTTSPIQVKVAASATVPSSSSVGANASQTPSTTAPAEAKPTLAPDKVVLRCFQWNQN